MIENVFDSATINAPMSPEFLRSLTFEELYVLHREVSQQRFQVQQARRERKPDLPPGARVRGPERKALAALTRLASQLYANAQRILDEKARRKAELSRRIAPKRPRTVPELLERAAALRAELAEIEAALEAATNPRPDHRRHRVLSSLRDLDDPALAYARTLRAATYERRRPAPDAALLAELERLADSLRRSVPGARRRLPKKTLRFSKELPSSPN